MTDSQGDVEIELNGQTETLRCTLRASKQVNAAFGNFMEAIRRVGILDQAAITTIVAAGLGKKPADVVSQNVTVEEAVFDAGCQSLVKPVADYIELLANGGRPWVAPTAGTDQGND